MGRTMPPRRIVTATGAEGGAYQEIGKRYQAILARAGVQLRLMPTDGALQNLAMLRDSHSGVDIALIQGGTTSEAEAPDIESLGTLFYEPLWIFARSELRGLRLNEFWMASLVARLLVLLIPIIGVLYPVLRFVPTIYGWMMRRKIERLYGELRFLEDELNAGSAAQGAESMHVQLDRLEEQANHLRVPVTYASMQYLLPTASFTADHIALARSRLEEQVGQHRPARL